MTKFFTTYLSVGLTALLTTSAVTAAAIAPEDPPFRKRDGILVEVKGRGVYTYDGDKVKNQSDCFDQCRLLWPPMYAEDVAKPKGSFTIFTRKDDGRRQWAVNGKPLYRWTSDLKSGDAGGDGVAGVWRLVKVSKTPAAKPADKPEEKMADKPAASDKKN
jgi:predicted lipoprotein with Yx(FWY)xxD motif